MRKNVLLIGDHPKDEMMSGRFPAGTKQLKVIFDNALNATEETTRSLYANYDIAIQGDGSFKKINELFLSLVSS